MHTSEGNKELIPLNIAQALKSVSLLDSILGSYPDAVNQGEVAEMSGDFYS